MTSFVYVRAKGSHRALGRAVGEAAREQVAASLAYYREHFVAMAGMSFQEARRRAQAHLVFARRHLPQYVEELAGLAEGSGQPFDDLLVPNCAEELLCAANGGDGGSNGGVPMGRGGRIRADGPPSGRRASEAGSSCGARRLPSRGCTAVALAVGGRHVVGHNMDWCAIDSETSVLFDLTGPEGSRLLTLAGAPYLPMLGMTSCGLASVSNSLDCGDNRPGVPNVFVRRWVLDAASVKEGCARACLPARARGSNHLWLDASGHLCDLETSATAAAVLPEGRWLAHTNHYLAPEMATYERSESQESRQRLERARALLAAGVARGDDPIRLVAAVLRDHGEGPAAICGHPAGATATPEESVTVASMICDLDSGRLYACAGPPCQNVYQQVSF